MCQVAGPPHSLGGRRRRCGCCAARRRGPRSWCYTQLQPSTQNTLQHHRPRPACGACLPLATHFALHAIVRNGEKGHVSALLILVQDPRTSARLLLALSRHVATELVVLAGAAAAAPPPAAVPLARPRPVPRPALPAQRTRTHTGAGHQQYSSPLCVQQLTMSQRSQSDCASGERHLTRDSVTGPSGHYLGRHCLRSTDGNIPGLLPRNNPALSMHACHPDACGWDGMLG